MRTRLTLLTFAALGSALAGPAWPQVAPAPSPGKVSEAPADKAAEQAEDKRVVTLGKSKVTLYGFLRLDTIYDTDRPNNVQIPGFILSPDLNAPLGPAAGHSDFSVHPRQTRLGLDFDGPTVRGKVKLSGKLEIDFYNLPATLTTLNSNSREFLRLRHAWARLDWGRFALTAGQREDLISPLAPLVNTDLVMWGAGNLADRRPQIRAELTTRGGVVFAGMVGVTGAADNQNLEGAGNVFFDGEASGVPTLQGRIGWTFQGLASKKKSTLGVWGHWARERVDASQTFANGRTRFTSDVLGFDLSLWLARSVWLKAEGWSGQNVDDVRGGIFQGVAGGQEIDAAGGWAELNFPIGSWTPLVGVSLDNPDDEFLPRKTATTNPGQDRNFVWYVGSRWRADGLELGLDYLRWRTEYAGTGVRAGVDNRFNFFLAYHF